MLLQLVPRICSRNSAAWRCRAPPTRKTRHTATGSNGATGALFELWRLWDSEIRKINPQARFIANSGGGSMTTLDMKTISELAPTLFADRQSRHGLMPPWANGKNGKEFRRDLWPKTNRRHRQRRHRR